MVTVFFSLIIETRGESRISQCGQGWVLSMFDLFFVMLSKKDLEYKIVPTLFASL